MFKKILVPLDRSALAEGALGPAAAIARACRASIDVLIVHQPSLAMTATGLSADDDWSDDHQYVESIANELESGAAIETTHAALRGDPSDMIASRAVEGDADLIVMTSHGRTGFSRAWLGSVTDSVIRQASIPVLMFHPVSSGARRIDVTRSLCSHILVPVDGSARSASILPAAIDLAKCSTARVTLLRIVYPIPLILPDPAMAFPADPVVFDEAATDRLVHEVREQMDGLAGRLRAEHHVDVGAYTMVSTRTAQAIVDSVPKLGADLIAMSTHGRSASRLLVGSVADKVIRASGVPILLQRHSGGDQPVAAATAVAASHHARPMSLATQGAA